MSQQQVNGENNDWKDKVRAAAVQFAQRTHMSFNSEMKKSLKLLPVDCPENRIIQLNSYMDTMVGVAVACGAEYAGDNLDVEEQFIKLVRAKFTIIRRAKLSLNKGVQ